MPLLRNVVKDLAEKRLWPVAALLVAALVAVPMVLGRAGGDAPAPVVTSDAGASAQRNVSRALVTLDPDANVRRTAAGALRNPFKAPKKAASSESAAEVSEQSPSTPSVVSSGGSSATAIPAVESLPAEVLTPSVGGSGGSRSTGADTTGSDTTSSDDAAAGKPTYKVSLRFGPTVGERETLRDVARLTVLPDAANAVVGLLGVLADGKTASFVPAPNVTASGEGTCKPSRKDCKTVDLRAGEAEYLRVAGADGQPDSWYYLELLHVDRAQASSARQASAAYARRSGAGAAVIRKAAASVRHVRYLPARGVLVRAKRSAKGQAAARVARGLVPLLPAPEQPGIAVWRSRKPAPSSP